MERDPVFGLDAVTAVPGVAPGAGEFDCVGYIRTMIEMGVTAPISLEVVNASMWEMPAEHTARMAADGMRAVLAAASV